jgi:hypothetical protein
MSADPYVAPDGKHYWNCWTWNYSRREDGYIIHAFCEENKTGRALCGVWSREGGGLSIPNDLRFPSCLRCRRIMEKRGALLPARDDRINQVEPLYRTSVHSD